MKKGLYWRLSVMMFFQYAIWGTWLPIFSASIITELKLTGFMLGVLYCLVPFGSLLSPLTGGQLADRSIPTQWVLAGAHLIGAVLLWIMGAVIDFEAMAAVSKEKAFWTLTGIFLVYSILYGPTLPLTQSLSFSHLKNVEKQFGGIRVWGTIGWIAAGVVLSAWRVESTAVLNPESVSEATTWIAKIWQPIAHGIGAPLLALLGVAKLGDCLMLGAVFSVIMGLFCLALPHTPPKREGVKPLAFVEAFKLMRDRNFLAYSIISFIVVTELWFFYNLTGPFLQQRVGIDRAMLSITISTAQVGEIITMAILLPILLPKLGVRLCLALGVIAWPIRYAVFAIGDPAWLVIASLPLHGFCYVFFFVVGQIYVDNAAPKDIRASAQSLWAVIVLGIGSIAGSIFAGWIQELFTSGPKDAPVTNWTGVFLVPMVLTVLCAIAFLLFFKEPEKKIEVASTAEETPPGA